MGWASGRGGRGVRWIAVLTAGLIAGGCGGASAPAGGSGAAGVTPVIIDTDLSTDDTVAIGYLLRDPSVEVLGVTLTGTGLVHCDKGLQVLASLLAAFGAGSLPIACGRDESLPGGHEFPAAWRASADAGFELAIEPVVVSAGGQQAPELLASLVRDAKSTPVLLALGPMTNIADAFTADTSLPGKIGRIVAMAGAVDVTGNVDLGSGNGPAEWNVYADPAAAAQVLAAKVPITLVPLDATNSVPVTTALIETLAKDHAAAPADVTYELLMRGKLSTIDYLWDPLAAVILVDERVATFESMPLKVETAEGADSGRTVRTPQGTPIRVAVSADRAAFEAKLLAGLRRGAPRPTPFKPAGEMTVRFDGTTCADTGPAAMKAGDWLVRFENTTSTGAMVALLKFHAGSGWQDLIAYGKDHPESMDPPSFVDVPLVAEAPAGGSRPSVVALGAGTYGFACLVPTPPPFLGHGSFEVGAP